MRGGVSQDDVNLGKSSDVAMYYRCKYAKYGREPWD